MNLVVVSQPTRQNKMLVLSVNHFTLHVSVEVMVVESESETEFP